MIGSGSQIQLFCVPYAGGSARAYWQWWQTTADGIDAIPLKLAGRESQIAAPYADSVAEAASDLTHALQKRSPAPQRETEPHRACGTGDNPAQTTEWEEEIVISQPHQSESSSSSGHEPSGVRLELVRQAWATALRHCDFSDDDNFFNVGGHSMLGIELMKRLETDLGARLPVRLLFENSTIRGLAAALRTHVSRPGEVQ